MPRSRSIPRIQPARLSLRYSSHSSDSVLGGPSSSTDESGVTTQSATARTFAILDLLEHILLDLCETRAHVPQLHLFPLQRVSRTFKRTIALSAALQRRMLLRYDSHGSGTNDDDDDDDDDDGDENDNDADDNDNDRDDGLVWSAAVKWLRQMDLLPDLWMSSHKGFGPCLQFGDRAVRVDSRLGRIEEGDEGSISGSCRRSKLHHPSASWRQMKVPTRWRGQELAYCMPISSAHGAYKVMFWLRSSHGEVTAGNLYDQVKAISGLDTLAGMSLASYCKTNIKRELVFYLRSFLPIAWPEHRDGMCMQYPHCIFCRASRAVDTLPAAVDWPLDGSRLTVPSTGTHTILNSLGYPIDKKR